MSGCSGWLTNSEVRIPLQKNRVYAFGRLPFDVKDERIYRIQISDPHISLTHCYIWMIQFDDESTNICYFQDMSTNGCLINNLKVGKGNIKILNNGDKIKLYDGIEFKFKNDNIKTSNQITHKNETEINDWKILDKIIGYGTFGKVHVAINKKENGKYYAVKSITTKYSQNNDNMSNISLSNCSKVESHVLKNIKHLNIIQIEETFLDKSGKNIKIFQELAIGGDLFSYLSQDNKYLSKIPESEAIFAIYQICNGLMYLHQNGIVHRDLKLDNILIMGVPVRYPKLKIADFGIAKKHIPIGESQMVDINSIDITNKIESTSRKSRKSYWMSTIVGTAEYAAPEINIGSNNNGEELEKKIDDFFVDNEHTKNKMYNEKVDSWSLGVISHILLSGVSPFYSENIKEIVEKSKKGILFIDNSKKWEGISLISKKFVKGCLEINVNKRLSIEQCIKNGMFCHGQRLELIQALLMQSPK